MQILLRLCSSSRYARTSTWDVGNFFKTISFNRWLVDGKCVKIMVILISILVIEQSYGVLIAIEWNAIDLPTTVVIVTLCSISCTYLPVRVREGMRIDTFKTNQNAQLHAPTIAQPDKLLTIKCFCSAMTADCCNKIKVNDVNAILITQKLNGIHMEMSALKTNVIINTPCGILINVISAYFTTYVFS